MGLSNVAVGFDEPVSIPSGAIIVYSQRNGPITGFAQSYDENTRTVTLTFSPALRDDRVTLILDYSIIDTAGNHLDGEITDPAAASLPSGNGTLGGQAVFRINVLQGDANRDGVVNSNDGSIIIASLGRVIGQPGFDERADLNGDGLVNVLDVATYRLAEGRALPPSDGVSPTISNRLPAPGSQVRQLSQVVVQVVFNEAVDHIWITNRSLFAIRPGGTLQVPISVQLTSANTVATFSFSSPLSQAGEYILQITNGLADADGDLLSIQTQRVWSFGLENSPSRISSVSPANGESGVAVTRESIIRFDHPINSSGVSEQSFLAEFGGQSLQRRVHRSQDGRSVTLFYTSHLPPSALIRVTVRGDLLTDDLGQAVDADGDGQPGGNAIVDFSTLTLTTLPNTAVCGRVFASELGDGGVNSPLAGVTIRVDGRESELFAITDVTGNYRLEPAPVGRFFVHVDGRTATNPGNPPGAYYPVVGKPFESIAGRESNMPNIYLPLVPADALAPVNQGGETVVTFPPSILDQHPELAGVNIVIPQGALFADDGTQGGMVGIAPVPPDRIPGPLPTGLDLPLVITFQTDGPTNLDMPVPAQFPNLPNPITSEVLLPGDKTALWSFDHDQGIWVVNGPMTVTADGLFVRSDSGFGIRAPGWHGSAPGTSGDGDAGNQPPTCDDATVPTHTHPCLGKSIDAGVRLAALLKCGALVPPFCLIALNKVSCAKGIINCAKNNPGALSDALIEYAECVANLERWYECVRLGFRGGDDIQQALDRLGNDLVVAQQAVAVNHGVLQAIHDAAVEAEAILQFANDEPPDYGLTPEQLQALSQWSQLISDHFVILDNNSPSIEVSLSDVVRGVEHAQSRLNEVFFEAVRRPLKVLIEDPTDAQRTRRFTTSASGAYSDFLQPNTYYRVSLLDPTSLDSGGLVFLTGPNGTRRQFTRVPLGPDPTDDPDNDLLTNENEYIVGTDDLSADTDGDGVPDGAEVIQGTNPLDGLIAQTGIVATADTPGTAIDACAINDIAIVADSTSGVTVFNVFNGLSPTRIAQVDTPGTASAVSCSGSRIAVADGNAGLAILDISDPPAAAIVRQIPQVELGGPANAVATAGRIAFAGTSSGVVAAVDLLTGTVLDRVSLPGAIHDVAIEAEHVFVLTVGRLFSMRFENGRFARLGDAASPGGVGAGQRRLRLFVGGGVAFAVHTSGFNTFDLANPNTPVLNQAGGTNQFGWKQIVANGSGVGVAAMSPNSTGDGPHHVHLYDLSSPLTPGMTIDSRYITTFETPGLAAAVSIYNGLAYVADSQSGIQVVNYRAYDTLGVPPQIQITSNLSPDVPIVEEGKSIRLTAQVMDDVQVRNVEFYVDGRRQLVDGNFPFEFRFNAPSFSVQSTIELSARAFDTGGSGTWTAPIFVSVLPDFTPPTVTGTAPANNGFTGGASVVVVFFSEPMALGSLQNEAIGITWAGADGVFDTEDDMSVPGGEVDFNDDNLGAFLTLPAKLQPGRYRGEVAPTVSDLAGNLLGGIHGWEFVVFDVADDTDDDCIPDLIEIELGLDRLNPDSDGDGMSDGEEDYDGDGLSNCAEIFAGSDLTSTDSDGDGLGDFEEVSNGTNPLDEDTDDDGFVDGEEVLFGANPLDAQSIPLAFTGDVFSALLLVANSTSANAIFGDIIESPIIMLNQSTPGAILGDINQFSIALLNDAHPGGILGDAMQCSLIVLNQSHPGGFLRDILQSAVVLLNEAIQHNLPSDEAHSPRATVNQTKGAKGNAEPVRRQQSAQVDEQ